MELEWHRGRSKQMVYCPNMLTSNCYLETLGWVSWPMVGSQKFPLLCGLDQKQVNLPSWPLSPLATSLPWPSISCESQGRKRRERTNSKINVPKMLKDPGAWENFQKREILKIQEIQRVQAMRIVQFLTFWLITLQLL